MESTNSRRMSREQSAEKHIAALSSCCPRVVFSCRPLVCRPAVKNPRMLQCSELSSPNERDRVRLYRVLVVSFRFSRGELDGSLPNIDALAALTVSLCDRRRSAAGRRRSGGVCARAPKLPRSDGPQMRRSAVRELGVIPRSDCAGEVAPLRRSNSFKPGDRVIGTFSIRAWFWADLALDT